MKEALKKPLVIGAIAIIAVLIIGTVLYLFMGVARAPKENVVVRYECPDESAYIVLLEDESIVVAGNTYEFTTKTEYGNRYENDGTIAFLLAGPALHVEDKTDGSILTSCTAQLSGSDNPALQVSGS